MKQHKALLLIQILLFCLIAPHLNAQVFQLQGQRSGLLSVFQGMGIAAADYNNDGFMDIYFVSFGPNNPNMRGSANALFKNNGDGTFTDVAKEAGVEGLIDTTVIPQNRMIENYGASWGDFDNDGDVDLFLTNKGVDQLYENMGDGTFTNISHSAGVDKIIRDSASSVWFDYDNDGDLDLYVCGYGEYGLVVSSDNIMYRNNGDATFTDVTAESGLREPGYTFVTMVFDANGDRWPDLYCNNDFGNNYFYVNNGDGTFTEQTRKFGLENDGESMGITLGDFDNNGLFDIYFSNMTQTMGNSRDGQWNPLFSQITPGLFQDVSIEAGVGFADWGWGVEFFDFDLDTDLDIYVVNGFGRDESYNRFFRNNGNKTFEEYGQQSGADSKNVARGLCIADFNNDGRLDIFVANEERIAPEFYLNTWQPGNYIKMNLIGTTSNRDARGAVVRLLVNGRNYCRPNDGVELYGQSKTPIHFGLGNAQLIQTLTVVWPSGTIQEFKGIPANQTITIEEDLGIIVGVKDIASTIPRKLELLKNYPNPVKNGTSFRFQNASSSEIKIEVFDLLGRLVATPVKEFYHAGNHIVKWNATNPNGQLLPSGVYIQKISDGNSILQGKLMIVR
jgi:hypothetical protein